MEMKRRNKEEVETYLLFCIWIITILIGM